MDYLLEIYPKSPYPPIILAHGAGAPMDSPWMNTLCEILKNHFQISTIRFEFPYMADRRLINTKRPPNSANVLLETWRIVWHEISRQKKWTKHGMPFIGGKSMGGRMATLIFPELEHPSPSGIIALGFPFQAPHKADESRFSHLFTSPFSNKLLIVQGTRDTFSCKIDFSKTRKKLNIKWLEDGDHGFKPRIKSGFTFDQHMYKACFHIKSFVQKSL